MPGPHAKMKQAFESKDKLVAAVKALSETELWLPRLSDGQGLGRISNKKLLRLHETLTAVKERFGSREALINAVLELEGRTGDAGYRARLASYPAPRLYDLYRAKSRRQKRAEKTTAAGKPAAAAAATKKALAKKAAKKAPAKKAAKKAAPKAK